MGVYLYQNNSELAMKNAYIGEVYEYSYDFRNKTTTNLTNDGWTLEQGGVSFSSNGISLSSGTVVCSKSIGNTLLNASKITIQQNCILSGTRTSTIFALSNGSTLSSSNTWTCPIIDLNGNKQQIGIYGTNTDFSGLSTGTYTQKLVLDFVNKSATLSCTGKADNQISITDTQISNILSNSTYIIIYIWGTAGYGTIGDVSLLVE